MLDRILAFIAMITLIGFLAILLWNVPRWDLGAVIAITLLLAGWDFFSYYRSGRGGR